MIGETWETCPGFVVIGETCPGETCPGFVIGIHGVSPELRLRGPEETRTETCPGFVIAVIAVSFRCGELGAGFVIAVIAVSFRCGELGA